MQDNNLIETYSWLEKVNTVEEYLPPSYYKDLLRPYTFAGVSDLEILEAFLKTRDPDTVLELGCGSGRASAVAADLFKDAAFTLSDLSERMLGAAKESLSARANFVVSDAVAFMEEVEQKYDLVYTLWSFSHSTHQHFHRLGLEDGYKYISGVMRKFILENINKNGAFFLIHFDSLSDEQSMLMRQWQRVFPTFANIDRQSPSKQVIEETLSELDTDGEIRLSMQHLRGDAIQYASLDVLLETFMNFHLETYFNESEHLGLVLEDLKIQAAAFKQDDGTYVVTPGCYVYSFIKT